MVSLVDWATSLARKTIYMEDANVAHDEADLLFSVEYRRVFTTACWHLGESFNSAERAHRVAFGLTGKLKDTADARQNYEKVCSSRREFFLKWTPAPAFSMVNLPLPYSFAIASLTKSPRTKDIPLFTLPRRQRRLLVFFRGTKVGLAGKWPSVPSNVLFAAL